MTQSRRSLRITTSAVFTPVPVSCGLLQVVIAVNGAGSGWQLEIRDAASPNPFVLFPQITVAVPTTGLPIVQNFQFPIMMQNGVKVVTSSGTPGELAIWLEYVTG